jgi:RNA polymerase sigma factor (sigma-70 family)
MKLKCQLAGAKCPPYSHEGEFQPDNATITSLLPDLRRCANCIAYEPLSLPAFRDDLIQIASITLIEKGPAFDPTHESGASFGTFIRPRVCVSLINAKHKELKRYARECSESSLVSDTNEELNAKNEEDTALILNVRDPNAECFVDRFIWEISVANFEKALPQLLEALTLREQQVFTCIREDMPNCDIAKMLKLSPPRISQLVRNVEQKLRRECQTLGLIE